MPEPFATVSAEVLLAERRGNKHGARRTWSELCQRWFASKAEAERGEYLWMLQEAGEIWYLEFQPRFNLCIKPKLTYTGDFSYQIPNTGYIKQSIHLGITPDNMRCIEDVKGFLPRDSRTRILWTQEKYGIRVKIVQRDGSGWKETYL